MAFTKDGFKKWITTGASGSDEYVLLANGGHKKITDWFTEIKSDTTNAVSVTVGGTEKNITTATLKNSLGLGSMAYDSGSYVKLYTYTIPATGNKGVLIQYQPYASVKITVSGANSGAQLVLVGTGYGDGGSVRAYFSKVTTFEDKSYTWCLGKANSCTVEVFSTRKYPDYVIVESSNSITFTAISALSDTANTEKILSTNTYSKYALPLSGGSLTGDLYTNKSIYVNHSYENQAAYIFKNTRTADNNSDRADNVLKCIDNNDALMWVLGHFGTGATDSYLYLGYGDYGSSTNLRIAPGGGVTVNSLNVVNQITRDGKSSSWINGRENALLRETKADGYHCVWSLKTNNGSWLFGEYRAENWFNIPLLTYTTDENYSNKSNLATYNIKFPMATGTVALTSNIPTSLKNPCALTIFNESYDGSSAKSIYNTTFISTLTDGTSDVTDGTMFVTSYAGDDGFSTTDKKNIPYKRKALYLYNYIKGKTDTLYVTSLGTDENYLTWTKNGTTNKVTVPYATKASKDENGANISSTYIPRQRAINPAACSTETGITPFNVFAYKSAGYPVYDDPEFADGNNSIGLYNNKSGSTDTTISRNTATYFGLNDSGNSSGYVLRIQTTGTNTTPGYGGFCQAIKSRANAVFVQIFRAMVPVGFSLWHASNPMGSGATRNFITDCAGTGKWEWYAIIVHCGTPAGTTNNFYDGGHIYLNYDKNSPVPSTSTPVTWYLSYANIIDITKGKYDGLRTRYSDNWSNKPDWIKKDKPSYDASEISGLANIAKSGKFVDLLEKPTTLSGYGITDGLPYHTVTVDLNSNLDWIKSVAQKKVNRMSFYYNCFGTEWSYLLGCRDSQADDNLQYGSILKFGYTDNYLRILRVKAGNWQSTDWEKISAGYADSAGSCTGNSATATKFKTGVTVTGGVLDTFLFTIDGSTSSVSAINTKYSCYSSVGSISSTKYHLIAEAIPYALATHEKHITFIIQGRGSSKFGLLYAYIRCENGTSTKAKITWIVRNGYPVDYVLGGVFKGTSTSVNTYFDIFLKKTSSYDSTAIRVIDSHGDGSSSKEYALYNPNTNFVYDSISAAGTSLHSLAYTETITAVEESIVNSTNKLTTARTLTIGNNGKTFDGTKDVAWTLSEIGAASSGHTHGNITNDGNLSTGNAPVITDTNKKITTTDYATFTKNLSVFKKDTAANTGGYIGVVPKPDYNSGSKTRFLREDGTWVTPTDTNTHTYTVNWSSVTASNAYPIAFSPNQTPKTSNNGYNAVLTYNPNTYSLKNNGCTLQYDVTNKCLKFVFS